MTKKDRIAVVVSTLYLILFIFAVFADGQVGPLFFLMPVFIYWGYRFTKGNISFIGRSDDQSQ